MLKVGVKVRAHCSKCNLTLAVDLELLKSHRGEGFSLIGKRASAGGLTATDRPCSWRRVTVGMSRCRAPAKVDIDLAHTP